MRYIDLRSDTVTQPTQAMRDAMAVAVVGDDVYQDDPTTTELERLGAEMLGKEAAIFVTSGTMGNQLGIISQTRRGDEIIVGDESHIVIHEVGAASVLSGVSCRQLHFKDTVPDPEMIERAIRGDDIHEPPTGLICMENALANGKVVPLDVMEQVWQVAKRHNLPVHLDGARVFNAATALGVDVKEITQYCDTINCCISKGLCAPVGALFAGPRETVERARKWRKLLGGGMRQNGFLAAAGIVALREMTGRLHIDHENARYMAEKLEKIPGVRVLSDRLDINMVFFILDVSEERQKEIDQELLRRGIKTNGVMDGENRWVTSNDISREDIDFAVSQLAELMQA